MSVTLANRLKRFRRRLCATATAESTAKATAGTAGRLPPPRPPAPLLAAEKRLAAGADPGDVLWVLPLEMLNVCTSIWLENTGTQVMRTYRRSAEDHAGGRHVRDLRATGDDDRLVADRPAECIGEYAASGRSCCALVPRQAEAAFCLHGVARSRRVGSFNWASCWARTAFCRCWPMTATAALAICVSRIDSFRRPSIRSNWMSDSPSFTTEMLFPNRLFGLRRVVVCVSNRPARCPSARCRKPGGLGHSDTCR